MSASTESIFIDALSLPTKERAALTEKLLLSLEPQRGSPEIEAAWKREALDRCQAYDDGKLSERPAENVLNDAYRKLK
jgi:putative addiction module component (TIGR02574 family)